MTPRERFQRIERLFRECRALAPEDRDRFVDRECGDDLAMRNQLLGMLRVDGQTPGVLDHPALGESLRLGRHVPPSAVDRAIPQRIGSYRIVGVLGEGGMGVVYEARQEHPSRGVALKVIGGHAPSERMISRFRQEAEVLGRLQHPGIAQIFEAGIDDWGDGLQPFLAMELVVGRPLLEFASLHALGRNERIALLARIADAVHHAHQKGVIHRDLKPGNILVVEADPALPASDGPRSDTPSNGSRSSGDLIAAQPKILDFGVARVLDLESGHGTALTRAGQLIGTPAYMSPEQAAGDVGAVDTRSDVYSLGVIGFELLTGRLPHEIDGKRLGETLHLVRSVPAPRLGLLDQRLRGDIETVIGKALAIEPSERYASSAEMAADLRRILREEPIQARRLGSLEQLWRGARRNRLLVGAVLAAAVALTAATGISLRIAGVAARHATEARLQAYRSSMSAAAAALRFHEVAEARYELEKAPQELRGWEWQHLWSRLDDSLEVLDFGRRTSGVVTFSPDGNHLVVADRHGGVHFWLVRDLRQRREATIEGGFRERWSTSLTYSKDGTALLVGTRRGVFSIDPTTLTVSPALHPDARVADIAAGPDLVATGSDPDRVTRVRSRQDGRLLLEVPATHAPPLFALSPGGRMIAVGDATGSGLAVHSIEGGAVLEGRPELRGIATLVFSPDERTLAVAEARGVIRLIDVSGARRPDRELAGHSGAARALCFSADGALLASAGADHTVRIWDAGRGRPVAVMQGNVAPPTGIAFSPDSMTVATVCADGAVRLWPATTTDDLTEDREEAASTFVLRMPETVYGVAFAPAGPDQRRRGLADERALHSQLWVACLGGDLPLRCIDYATLTERAARGSGYLSAVAVHTGSARIAIGRSQHAASEILDAGGERVGAVPGHNWRTDWVDFSLDGSRLYSLGNSGRLWVHEASSGRRLAQVATGQPASELGMRAALSPDRSLLALSDRSLIRLLDAETLAERGRLETGSAPVLALAFSPDGRELASGGAGGAVLLWDVAAQRQIARMTGPTEAIYALAYHPSGDRLASGGADGVVRIWDPTRGEELAHLSGHGSFVYCLAWSPDGACLASGGGDATVRLWDTRAAREVARARVRCDSPE